MQRERERESYRERERERERGSRAKDPSTMVPVPHYDKPLFIPFETS